MKYFVAIVALCLNAVLAKSFEAEVLESPVRISTREVTVEVINSNLTLSEQVNAATVLTSIYPHLGNNQDRAWTFTETYDYLSPECIWSVAINSETVHVNRENGKTGFVLMAATDNTNQVSKFYAFSTPKNGASCVVP